MKIESVVGINGYTLLIYSSLDRLFRFGIIDASGTVFNFDSIFLTSEEANIKGRAALGMAFDFDYNQHQR